MTPSHIAINPSNSLIHCFWLNSIVYSNPSIFSALVAVLCKQRSTPKFICSIIILHTTFVGSNRNKKRCFLRFSCVKSLKRFSNFFKKFYNTSALSFPFLSNISLYSKVFHSIMFLVYPSFKLLANLFRYYDKPPFLLLVIAGWKC